MKKPSKSIQDKFYKNLYENYEELSGFLTSALERVRIIHIMRIVFLQMYQNKCGWILYQNNEISNFPFNRCIY